MVDATAFCYQSDSLAEVAKENLPQNLPPIVKSAVGSVAKKALTSVIPRDSGCIVLAKIYNQGQGWQIQPRPDATQNFSLYPDPPESPKIPDFFFSP